MKTWIIVAALKNEQGHAQLDKITVLELFKHDCEPHDRLKLWCQKFPEDLIYVLVPVISGVGFNEFKVTITKHAS